MKFRKSAASAVDKVDINMTPMIDVVFQLLSFFIMSFKIVSQEGDFNIKMPLAAREGSSEDYTPAIKIYLDADGDGNLTDILTSERRSLGTNFDSLHEHVVRKVGGYDAGPGRDAAEVELDCDYNLKYENVVKAITAVSGKRSGDQIFKLVEKIKFSPPRK